jgi:hypothetical protein
MNSKQAYEAYRLECAKRDGVLYFHEGVKVFNAVGIPAYKDDNDIDRIIRLLSDEELRKYHHTLLMIVVGTTISWNFFFAHKAAPDQKRLALYKVFGIEVTE